MTISAALPGAFQAAFYRQRESSDLAQPTSPVVRAVARAAATTLVLASAGFGAVYSWSTGSEHGPILAALSVMMAVGLEATKPLAVAHALTALRSFAVVRGTCLATLAIVAIAYSLSAELSLMATTRGDRVAERAAESNVAIKARSRYERANLEIDRLPTARPSSELQSLIDGVLADPRAGGCVALDGPYTREHCPHVVEWKAEQARAQRRAELESTMREAEREMASGPVARAADPGATALATYLAIFGLKVEAGLLTELLILIGVLALEVGSAFAGVLVHAVSATSPRRAVERRQEVVTNAPEPEPVVQVVHPQNTDDAATRERVKSAILDQLEKRGGSIAGSERGLAALINASRPTVRRAIHGLVLAGIVAAEATRNGTMLRLVT